MKRRNRETVVTLVLAIGLFGCAQKPAEEGAQSKTAKSAPPRPAAVTLTVPTGTELDVRLITGLNSEVNKTGDAFDGTIETPVMVGEKTAIPKGAEVTGRVTSAVAPRQQATRKGARPPATSSSLVVGPVLVRLSAGLPAMERARASGPLSAPPRAQQEPCSLGIETSSFRLRRFCGSA